MHASECLFLIAIIFLNKVLLENLAYGFQIYYMDVVDIQ